MKNKKLLISMLVGFAVFAAVAVFMGKFSLLIWGLILLCPLIHLFGHNHSGHNHPGHSDSGRKQHDHNQSQPKNHFH